ncbi:family 20 glycosylhydrolase [Paramicrobacterium chengjingii]|uniref:Family 20 glycosylhydrolase n=1 Tax=Paramicrobacterium chengjingii TaxID=2769067 RepID=A0ABX6YFK2_9MICO|nr:family 20 glycosylhydrolase [Microbacterium chengjingii]QPZ37571.1 family 20 glycosylhydrolase [Microbacterium chengjingii]
MPEIESPATGPLTWTAIPQPHEVELRHGSWAPTTVSVIASDARLRRERERFDDELRAYGAVTRPEPAAADDECSRVELRLDHCSGFGPEGYAIEVGHDVVVRAQTPCGVFRATRQLMHNLRAHGRVPAASVRAEPAVAERGLHIDAARKFYPARWLEQLIVNAADIGLTTLQWHFSENEGVRLESISHPAIVSPEYITRAEATHLIRVANDHHIEIVPSLDMPGHLKHALGRHPEFCLPGVDGALDITNDAAVAFARELVDDYVQLFDESRVWNLGGDEFVDFDHMHDYPVLDDAAKKRFGATGTGFDLLTAFVNTIAAYLTDRDVIPRVWNDGMLRSRNVVLDERVQFAWWTNWSASMRPVQEAFDGGYDVVNVNDAMFYYVLGENAGYTYPTSKRLWEAEWHPGVFPMLHPSLTDRAQIVTQPYPEQLVGASFAIWSDRPEAQTCDEVALGIRSPLRAFAERSWNAGSALTHSEFTAVDEGLPPVSYARD